MWQVEYYTDRLRFSGKVNSWEAGRREQERIIHQYNPSWTALKQTGRDSGGMNARLAAAGTGLSARLATSTT